MGWYLLGAAVLGGLLLLVAWRLDRRWGRVRIDRRASPASEVGEGWGSAQAVAHRVSDGYGMGHHG